MGNGRQWEMAENGEIHAIGWQIMREETCLEIIDNEEWQKLGDGNLFETINNGE